jgi:lipopolysaccharide biosynthesis regulator YciM
MFDSILVWLLLPLGAALGFAWARGGHGAAGPSVSREDTMAGLNSLANDNADQAIAALSRAADAEPAAAELQLTLGGLFRKRGEIDRAIHLHEALLARSDLPPKIIDAARIELAQDYLKAGLLDRAESLLQGMEGSSAQLAAALELLLDLYEQAHDWPQAIEAARRLQSVKGQSSGLRLAQYSCELAEAAQHGGDAAAAARYLQQALDYNPECVRASLAQAAQAEAAKDSSAAIKAYWRAMQQDGRYFAEVAPALERCYAASGDKRGYTQFLEEAETALAGSAAPALFKARWMQAQGEDLRPWFGERLARQPTRQGMLLWLETAAAQEGALPWLNTLQESLKKSLQARPRYACTACGLQPSMLFWQCPRCKRWETVAPVEEKL